MIGPRRAEIYDIGYRQYRGTFEGRTSRVLALVINGMRTATGLGRGMPAKILPSLLFLALIVPAIVFMIIALVAGGDESDAIGVSAYYSVILVPLLLFSAAIAPELLTTDRRSGLLSLYLVRPITVEDYVLGRWLSFFLLTLLIVWLGQILLFVGVFLGADDTWDYLQGNWVDILRFLLAGVVLALFTTTLPLAVAAVISRRAFAAAVVIGGWFVAAAVGTALAVEFGGTMGAWLGLIDFGASPIHLNDLIFGISHEGNDGHPLSKVPVAAVVCWYLIWIIAPGAVLWRKYRGIGA